MPVVAEAFPFLGLLTALAAVLAILFGPWAVLPVLVLALFVLWFFRDPERRSPVGEGLVLAPADGRVTAVEQNGSGTTVSIFLSVFDCHINRSPVAGVVTDMRYTAGRFRPAFDRRAGENERNRLTIRTSRGDFGVTQIAGLVARRIVCQLEDGQTVRAGERYGLIRFGSRVDVYLPAGVAPLVVVGQRAIGGETVLADLGSEAPPRTGEVR